jgi:dipeptidyl aminopeptidase/acylaminoacyl peptidase
MFRLLSVCSVFFFSFSETGHCEKIMDYPKQAAFGSWRSPITSDLIVSGSIGLGAIAIDGESIYWTEMRPAERGRYVIVRHDPSGRISDITPPPLSARTRVHEYGGGAYTVANGVVYFSNFADQFIYRVQPGSAPQQLTSTEGLRYADAIVDIPRNRLICVREDHRDTASEAVSTLVSIDLAQGASETVLVEGADFYSTPRLSPDGTMLAWLCWHHPNMPWDGSELWTARISDDGTLVDKTLVAGSVTESIFQPEWSPGGLLHFVSDRTGWWNLYRVRQSRVEAMCPLHAEFGLPQWVFGMRTYAFASDSQIVCVVTREGIAELVILDTITGKLESIETPFKRIEGVRVAAGKAYFTAASLVESTAIITLDLETKETAVIKRSTAVEVGAEYISQPEGIEFPTGGALNAYAFFYPPKNRDFIGLDGELPPLLVMSHGGPTAATSPTFSLGVQYWTSRGFAVVDVNYGGSTGYGRSYRLRLNREWGVVDVDDCANAAKYLVERGFVDSKRLAITGGSAGGYTTLCALVFRDVFSAGASHYGVSDLEALEVDTHKFESRYTHGLVGNYPEERELYYARSPIHFTDRLSAPVIFFQGLEDKIVPPNQAELMVNALRAKGLPVAYVTFEGEQHGFRQAANIKRALDGEFYFYSRVFGFEPADAIDPIPIENL